jgi:hypothetical protein
VQNRRAGFSIRFPKVLMSIRRSRDSSHHASSLATTFHLSATRSTTRTVSSAFPCPRRRLRIRPRCHSLPATLFLPNLLSLPTAIEILTRCSNVQVSPSSVLRHRAARLHVVLPLPMLEFRICLQLSELKDPTPRTRTASSCLGFSRVLLSRLVLTKTSGLASHQSRMRQSHVRLRLLA